MNNPAPLDHAVPLGCRKHPGLRGLTDRSDLKRRLAKHGRWHVSVYENPNPVWPRYPFLYEDPDAPGLAVLRKRYRLEHIVAPGRSELEKLVLLRGWVKRRWVHAAPDVSGHDRMNALDLLGQAEKGKRFYCHHYALTYVQCCLALGWQARMLGIFRRDFGGHNVAEVWADSLGKWVVMDPDYDCHYECDGMPLNALELHRSWGSKVRLCLGEAGDRSEQGRQIRAEPAHLVDYYHRFFLFMGNAFFQADPSQPVVAVARRRLRWFDSNTPKGLSAGCRAESNLRLTGTFSRRPEDFYWDLHRVHIDLGAPRRNGTVRVYLTTRTPGFRDYRVHVDGMAASTRNDSPFSWRLHSGRNRIEAAVLNGQGRAVGLPSVLETDGRLKQKPRTGWN